MKSSCIFWHSLFWLGRWKRRSAFQSLECKLMKYSLINTKYTFNWNCTLHLKKSTGSKLTFFSCWLIGKDIQIHITLYYIRTWGTNSSFQGIIFILLLLSLFLNNSFTHSTWSVNYDFYLSFVYVSACIPLSETACPDPSQNLKTKRRWLILKKNMSGQFLFW